MIILWLGLTLAQAMADVNQLFLKKQLCNRFTLSQLCVCGWICICGCVDAYVLVPLCKCVFVHACVYAYVRVCTCVSSVRDCVGRALNTYGLNEASCLLYCQCWL